MGDPSAPGVPVRNEQLPVMVVSESSSRASPMCRAGKILDRTFSIKLLSTFWVTASRGIGWDKAVLDKKHSEVKENEKKGQDRAGSRSAVQRKCDRLCTYLI